MDQSQLHEPIYPECRWTKLLLYGVYGYLEGSANVQSDTDDEKAKFLDPQNLYAYRRKMESTSNGIFKNLVFDETVPEVKKGLYVFHIGMLSIH